MSSPRAEIGELWRQIHRETRDRFRQAFRGCELPFIALILLRQIKMQPGVTVSELARQSGTVKSHVSKMVEQLVRQGYVEKKPDPTDQRLLRVYLTQTATDTMAGMEDRAHGIWSEVMEEIPEGQIADVTRGLRILLAALESANRKLNRE